METANNELCAAMGRSDPNETYSPQLVPDVSGPDPSWGRGVAGALGGRPLNTAWALSVDGRHNKGSNFLLLDGHVKWLMPNMGYFRTECNRR